MANNDELSKMFDMFKQVMESGEERNRKAFVDAIKAAREPNVIEAEEIRKKVEKERRQSAFKEYAREAEENQKKRISGCTHSVWPATAENAGWPAPRGQGRWTTGGQVNGHKEATLVCLRCGSSWTIAVSPEQIETIAQNGMRGWAPPDLSQCTKVNGTAYRDGKPVPEKIGA